MIRRRPWKRREGDATNNSMIRPASSRRVGNWLDNSIWGWDRRLCHSTPPLWPKEKCFDLPAFTVHIFPRFISRIFVAFPINKLHVAAELHPRHTAVLLFSPKSSSYSQVKSFDDFAGNYFHRQSHLLLKFLSRAHIIRGHHITIQLVTYFSCTQNLNFGVNFDYNIREYRPMKIWILFVCSRRIARGRWEQTYGL